MQLKYTELTGRTKSELKGKRMRESIERNSKRKINSGSCLINRCAFRLNKLSQLIKAIFLQVTSDDPDKPIVGILKNGSTPSVKFAPEPEKPKEKKTEKELGFRGKWKF